MSSSVVQAMAGPSLDVRQRVDALIAFVKAHQGALPRQRSDDDSERSLAASHRDLKSRVSGPIRGGKRPSCQQLTPSEVKYFDLIAREQSISAASLDQITDAPAPMDGSCAVAPGLRPNATPAARRGADAAPCQPGDQEMPIASPGKRLRCKSPASAATGLRPSAVELGITAPVPAAGGEVVDPGATLSQQLTLRGLNINWPFSQLLLLGAKTVEARRFPLGHRNIAHAGEELFLIETPPKCASAGVVSDHPVGPRPQAAQVVGTVIFSGSEAYADTSAWKRDREKHCIKEGAPHYDWTGEGEMHAWHVGAVKRFAEPVPAGSKSQTGYGAPRTLDVKLATPSS